MEMEITLGGVGNAIEIPLSFPGENLRSIEAEPFEVPYRSVLCLDLVFEQVEAMLDSPQFLLHQEAQGYAGPDDEFPGSHELPRLGVVQIQPSFPLLPHLRKPGDAGPGQPAKCQFFLQQ